MCQSAAADVIESSQLSLRLLLLLSIISGDASSSAAGSYYSPCHQRWGCKVTYSFGTQLMDLPSFFLLGYMDDDQPFLVVVYISLVNSTISCESSFIRPLQQPVSPTKLAIAKREERQRSIDWHTARTHMHTGAVFCRWIHSSWPQSIELRCSLSIYFVLPKIQVSSLSIQWQPATTIILP